MGHFRLKLDRAGAIPHDARLGVRLRRLAPGEDARGRRTFGREGCVASFDSWSITTDPDPIVTGAPFTYYVWPSSSSVLCDGDCLEWSAEWTGCPGATPSYTLTAGEDCVGATIVVDDTAEAVEGCTLTLTATLAGAPFGDPVRIEFPLCWPECYGYTGGGTFPEFLNSVTPYTISFAFDGDFCDFIYSFSYQVETSIPIQASISGLPDAVSLDLYVDAGNEGISLAGLFVTVQLMLDGVDGGIPLCDPVTFYCEV